MTFTHSCSFFPCIIVNNISIPLTPVSPQEPFSPSAEAIEAWYLAYYGTANLFDLDPEILATSIEELAQWWTKYEVRGG